MTCLVLFCAIFLIVGCGPKRWTTDQLEGRWRVRVDNADEAAGAGIALNRDGRFVATAVPASFLGIADGKPILSGTGTWSIIQLASANDERLELTFTKVEGVTLQ